ncbi:unnamed protein product [Peronospora effusa]|nr:unnamed protein product [Peronospora effusa]
MKTSFQPYGRVSSRGALRKGIGWDLRMAMLIVVPIMCLIVVLYEFLYLQEYAANGVAVDISVENHDVHLRSNQEIDSPSVLQPPGSQSVVNGRKTIILVANYRDSTRCSEMLRSIFDNAVAPDDIKISIYDQIYPTKKELSCSEEFCKLVGEKLCRRSQIVSSQIDAANATGPTTARYETVKAVTDEDFCMAIDSHLVFVPNWDEKIIAQWDSLDNPNAIITVYPMSVAKTKELDDILHFMCMARIETDDPDAMVQYIIPLWINKTDMPKPRLSSQLAGGFNFGGCKQAKEVRDDPYTPYLFHGEEYSRAARLWTNGYDFYAPSENIVYHWYEKRKVVWERDWNARYLIQQKSRRRVRYSLKLPVTKEDFDHTDLKKTLLLFDNCHELKYVPY